MDGYIPEDMGLEGSHVSSTQEAEAVRASRALVPTWAIAGILAILAAAIVFVSSGLMVNSEFESESASTFRTSRRLLERNILLLNAMGGFTEASSPLSYEGFLTFTSKVLAGREGVAGVGWAPLVSSSQRRDFEAWVSAQTQEPYEIFNMTLEGVAFPITDEPTFAPIAFLVPRGLNRGAIGLNILSRGLTRSAFERAREERHSIGTAPFRLAQEKENQLGIVLYHPVFSRGAALPPGTAVGRDGFLGVVFVALRMDDTLLGTLDARAKEGLVVTLADVSDLPSSMKGNVLSRVRKSEEGWVALSRSPIPEDESPYVQTEAFSFAGRSWTLSTYRPPTFRLEKRLMESGIAFAVVFFALFLSGTARGQKLARERERDALLATQARNELLRTEMLKRSAVQKENEILAASVEESPDIVKIADEQKTIIHVNKAGRAFFRIPEGAPLPLFQLGTFHTEESRRELDDVSFPAACREGSWRGECTVLDSAGRPLRMSAVLVATRDELGSVKNYALILRDLSERVAMQRKLETVVEDAQTARGQAERMAKAKDEFLRVLSHELRSPLTPILGWVGMLKEGMKKPDELDKALEIIERNANTQLRLINDLLEMARLIGGRLDMEGAPVNVRTVLAEALSLVQLSAKAKRLSLTFDDRSLTVPVVMGDAARLTQVFWNLLSNAVKFTPAEGHVTARLSVAGNIVRVEVEDDGIGIDSTQLPHIFERFQKSDTSFARTTGGTGIGLALVKGIVEIHGGSVEVRSGGPGQGTSFSCLFPLSPVGVNGATSPETPSPEVQARPLAGARILVVDDTPDTLSTLVAAFSSQGATPVSAATATEALALLAGEDFDLMVSDLGLPDFDGLELVRRLRSGAAPRNAQMPAVALTAHASQETHTLCLSSGFQAHLPKPCDVRVLVQVVGNLVRRAKTTSGTEPKPDLPNRS